MLRYEFVQSGSALFLDLCFICRIRKDILKNSHADFLRNTNFRRVERDKISHVHSTVGNDLDLSLFVQGNPNFIDAGFVDLISEFLCDHLTSFSKELTGEGVDHRT